MAYFVLGFGIGGVLNKRNSEGARESERNVALLTLSNDTVGAVRFVCSFRSKKECSSGPDQGTQQYRGQFRLHNRLRQCI